MITERLLRDAFPTAQRDVYTARGAFRWVRPHAIERDTKNHFNQLIAGNEALARLLRNPIENRRVMGEIERDFVTLRTRLAGVAAFSLQKVVKHVNDWRTYVK